MRTRKPFGVLWILFILISFWNCDSYDNLYGNGKDDKNKKDQCKASAALYLSCSSENPGYANTACSSQYLLAVASCGYGGGGGGGGGGY
ncbi:hypothetical protein ACE5IS_07810 [Leptospira wolffii]|uniref:Lipoprotein n=1 Tax=Leptospira wolffii TaxID=409998 RepID=A0ABV5BM21_9LEPT